MLQKSTKFSLNEVVFVAVNSIITKLFLIFPATLISIGKSGSILLLVYISLIASIILYSIGFLYKKFGHKSIFEITKTTFGKFFNTIYTFVFSILLILITGLFLRCVSESINLSLMPGFRVSIISAMFLLTVSVSAFFGLKAIVRCHGLIVPITFAITLLLFLGNISSFDLTKMFPLIANNKEFFIHGVILCGFYSDFIIVTLILPYIQDDIKIINVVNKSFFISFFTMLLIVSAVLFATIDNSFIPVFNLGQSFKLGKFTPRIESVFTAGWFLSFFANFSLCLYFSCKLISGNKNYKLFIVPVSILIFIISLIPENIMQLTCFLDYLAVIRIVIFFILPVFILSVANIKERRK